MAEPNGKVRFDWTVNPSVLIMVVVGIASIVGSAAVLKSQVAGIEGQVASSFTRVELRMERGDDRMAKIEDSVNQLRIENAKRDSLARDMEEIKAQIKELQRK